MENFHSRLIKLRNISLISLCGDGDLRAKYFSVIHYLLRSEMIYGYIYDMYMNNIEEKVNDRWGIQISFQVSFLGLLSLCVFCDKNKRENNAFVFKSGNVLGYIHTYKVGYFFRHLVLYFSPFLLFFFFCHLIALKNNNKKNKPASRQITESGIFSTIYVYMVYISYILYGTI